MIELACPPEPATTKLAEADCTAVMLSGDSARRLKIAVSGVGRYIVCDMRPAPPVDFDRASDERKRRVLRAIACESRRMAKCRGRDNDIRRRREKMPLPWIAPGRRRCETKARQVPVAASGNNETRSGSCIVFLAIPRDLPWLPTMLIRARAVRRRCHDGLRDVIGPVGEINIKRPSAEIVFRHLVQGARDRQERSMRRWRYRRLRAVVSVSLPVTGLT